MPSLPPLPPGTTARSAGSFKGFRDSLKWGQKQSEKEILRSLSPNAYAHEKKVGVTPGIFSFLCRYVRAIPLEGEPCVAISKKRARRNGRPKSS